MPRSLLALVLLGIALPLHATSYVVPPDRELVRRADAIVIGAALTSYTQRTPAGGIETVTVLSVHDVLKGIVRKGELEIHEPGGVDRDRATLIPGAPRFIDGERVLLFLTRTPQHTWAVTDLALGRFGFDGTELVREDDARRDADRFVRFVRATAAGALVPADYFVSTPQALRLFGSDAVYTAASYTYLDFFAYGDRWTTFPSQVPIYSGAAAEPPAPGGGVTTLQSAINAWDSDPCSNVNYFYAGVDKTHTAGVLTPDGANTVQFERSLAQYGIAPFSCSYGGVLGIGAVTWPPDPEVATLPTHSYNGQTFFTAQEADVEMNAGLGVCLSLFTNGVFDTAVTHELGHTLGFRHSNLNRADSKIVDCTSDPTLECTSVAVMRSSIVSGLGFTLQPWDQHAVRAVYASACGSARRVRGDFDGDGRADILWRNTSDARTLIWFMNGATVARGSAVRAVDTAFTPLAGDFNGDGRADLVWYNPAAGVTDFWLLDGTLNETSKTAYLTMGAPWQIAGVADFDGDRKDDVLWRNPVTGATFIWFMNGTAVARGSATRIVDLSFAPTVGDFNGDGRADIVWYSATTGVTDFWLLNGTLTPIASTVYRTMAAPWRVQTTLDFDGDGNDDVVWRNGTGQLFIWSMNGGIVTRGSSYFGPDSTWTVNAGDFNGDGKGDVVFVEPSTSTDEVWIFNGVPPALTSRQSYLSLGGPWRIAAP